VAVVTAAVVMAEGTDSLVSRKLNQKSPKGDFGLIEIRYTGGVPERYKRNPNTSCLICKKLIYRRPVEMERNHGRSFCGSACFGVFCRKEKPCAICGKPILSGDNKKTCSRACANKNRIGMNYSHRPLRDKVKNQRSLKIRLLNLRGKRCQRCGYDKIEILQVHHKDRKKDNNNLGNLELICPNCHYEEHFLENSWLKNVNGVG